MRGEASLIEVASCMLMMGVAGPSFNTQTLMTTRSVAQ